MLTINCFVKHKNVIVLSITCLNAIILGYIIKNAIATAYVKPLL